jgi:TonB-linked SusC/RagA family outer membrane protein
MVDTKVFDILDELFKDTDVSYRVYDRQIALIDESVTFPGNPLAAGQMNAGGQQPTVSGKVTDSDGQPLPGVTVVVKGTTQGTVTNADGNYSLSSIPEDATLVFSFVGMRTQEIVVGNQTSINVTMEIDAIGIEEVVAVGYGTMKKSDITGAISSVSGEELAETISPSFLEQAQGKLAGVDIVKNNGSPGANSTIRIRGNRSINASNEPLFVVDGIPTTQSISDFNPRDIESVEVLKDASAVAIYGSRGANGVILITTKRGKSGKALIEVNNYYGIKSAVEDLELMTAQDFIEYRRVAYGVDRNDSSQDELVFLGYEDNLKNETNTNWLDLIFQIGKQQEHQLSVSGGNSNLRYYISGSYYFEEGLIKQADYERFSLRTNIDGDVSEKLNVGVSLTASTDIRNQMPTSLVNNAIQYPPILEPYDENGQIIPYPDPVEKAVPTPLLNYAPNQYVNETKGYRFFSNLFGNYSFSKNLSYRLNFGTDVKVTRGGQFDGGYDGSTSDGSINNNFLFAYTLENILTYDKTIDNHGVNIVGLFSTQKQTTENSSLSGRHIPLERSAFFNLGSAGEVTGINSGITEWGLLSYMARLNYRYKDRYLLTISGRADGSSRLAAGNKWDFFPSASVAWIISEENFLNSSVLTFLKARLGYGKVGNTSIQPYQTMGGLARSIYAFRDEGAFGYSHSKIANDELKWETSQTTNLGIDFNLWNGKLSGNIEYYNTKTTNLLLERFIPTSSGFNSILENVGSTKNRGWELSLSYNIINNNSGFKWDIDANIFSNKEEIVELFKGKSDDIGNRWFIGYPINVFYDYKFDGIWQSSEAEEANLAGQAPGHIKIADVNGRDEEGNLTNKPDGLRDTDDRTIIGSTVPDWSGGLTNRFTYKGFNFSMLLYSRQGQTLQSQLHNLSGNAWEGRRPRLNFNYWTPDNPSNEIPMPRFAGAPLYATSLQYFDGSFVKIKNITLGYDFARNIIKDKKVSVVQLYFSALNPLIFSKYNILDPETSNGVVGGNSHFSSSTYIIGLNLKF